MGMPPFLSGYTASGFDALDATVGDYLRNSDQFRVSAAHGCTAIFYRLKRLKMEGNRKSYFLFPVL